MTEYQKNGHADIDQERIVYVAHLMAEKARCAILWRDEIAIAYSDVCYLNGQLGLSIDKRILSLFNKLTKDDVVWDPSAYLWRPRMPEDIPGRNQGLSARARYFDSLLDKSKD